MTTNRQWLPDLGIGLVVALFGLWEAFTRDLYHVGDEWTRASVAVAIAVAVGLYRLGPGFALLLVWIACSIQLLSGTEIMYVQLAIMLVAFGTARHGSPAVVWASGLSIPVGAVIAGVYVLTHGMALAETAFYPIVNATGWNLTRPGSLFLGLIGLLILAVPWLVGLVLRIRAQAAKSRELQIEAETARAQAQEIADLRAEQTRLAHDVHDVVGHSLAVILAQAESAHFLPKDDPERIHQTMANIATSARQSLQDVRQVLSPTDSRDNDSIPGGLERLIEGVRGDNVQSTVIGTPRPLPPELEVVAYRVLQEMLTNAIKHGVPGKPVTVMRHWADELTIAVQNSTGSDPAEDTGLGLAGMRLRLESVSGRLDVRRDGGSFTVTAWLPLRPAGCYGTVTP